MGSFSFGEIFTILVIVLIVFGPKRLPEMARRIGQVMGRARAAVRDFTDTVQQEYGEEASTIEGVVEEFDGMRRDIGSAMGAVTGSKPLAPKSPPKAPNTPAGPPPDGAGTDETAITDVTAFSDDDWPTRAPDEEVEE